MCFKGSQVVFLNYDVFLPLKVVLVLSNSADPNEMQHYAAFHLGLHSLPNNTFKGFTVYKALFSVCKKLNFFYIGNVVI